MVRPGSDIFFWSSLFPICAIFCYASATVTVRIFDNSTSNAVLSILSVAAAIGALILAVGTVEFSTIHKSLDILFILACPLLEVLELYFGCMLFVILLPMFLRLLAILKF